MGNLPTDRGVDYCCPFTVGPMVHSKCHLKIYVAVFVCFATKALHLEMVRDLTTNSFLSIFDRFISRRGSPNIIWSDNATKFVGPKNEIVRFLNSKEFGND